MNSHDVLVVLNSSRFGQGNPQLGEKLMKAFLEALKGSEERPRAILLYNAAVVLATDQSPVCPLLQSLEEDGIEILVNEDSLTFYGLGSVRKVGEPVSMEDMTARMLGASLILKP